MRLQVVEIRRPGYILAEAYLDFNPTKSNFEESFPFSLILRSKQIRFTISAGNWKRNTKEAILAEALKFFNNGSASAFSNVRFCFNKYDVIYIYLRKV